MRKQNRWDSLLAHARIEGDISPIPSKVLDAFEFANNVKLPSSYREFCTVFGCGSLSARIWVNITTPGHNSPKKKSVDELVKESIEVLNAEVWPTAFVDLDEYCSNPDLIRQGLFFGRDIYTHHYFWNKSEITDKKSHEMAVYVIFRELEIHRLADTFESFIYDICLDKGIPNHGKLDEDPPVFYPVATL